MTFNLVDTISKQLNSGYWKVDDKIFFNKTECLRFVSKNTSNTSVTYHFFDEIFRSQDWRIEPEETLDELYKKRALQIREKYDYLILAYSGGSDSSNILETFIKNKIKLDEICTYYPVLISEKLKSSYTRNNRSPANAIFEYNEVVIPRLKELEKTNPEIVITIVDYTKKSLELITNEKIRDVAMAGIGPSIQFTGSHMIAEKCRSLNDRYKSVGCIYGVDKPRIILNQNREFGLWFLDQNNQFGHYDNDTFAGFNINVEYFYYSYEMPQIVRKQAWMLKQNILKDINLLKSGYKINNVWAFDTQRVEFEKLLYPQINHDVWQANKVSSFFYMENGDWFFKNKVSNKKIHDYFDGQILDFISEIDKKYIVYRDNKPDRLIDFYTKPIYF